MRKVLVAALSITAFAVSVSAQSKPNLSGTWVLDTAKSDFGPMPPPDSRIDVIDHNDPVIKDTVTAKGGMQGDIQGVINYTTDGKEVTNSLGGRDVKSTLAWEGNNLVVNSKLTFNDAEVSIKNVWALSDDAKMLTQTAHITSPMGEFDQKLVFNKQEAGAATATAPSSAATNGSATASAKPAPVVGTPAANGAKPNFSGTWKLDVTKSDFGVLPPDNARTDVIEQTDSAMKVSVSQDAADGKRDYVLNLTTDGKEAVNNAGGLELKSTVTFEGANLVMSTKLKFQDNDVSIKDVWQLSEDGKTLTRNGHLESPMGETDQKLIFAKVTPQ